MELGEKILAVAKAKGLELTKVAERASVPYDTLRNYVKAGSTRTPGADIALRLARALDVDLVWLIDEKEDWPPRPFMASPRFRIHPWPPELLSWEDLQGAIAYVLLVNTQRLWGEIGKMGKGRTVSVASFAKKSLLLTQCLVHLGALYGDRTPQTASARQIIQAHAGELSEAIKAAGSKPQPATSEPAASPAGTPEP